VSAIDREPRMTPQSILVIAAYSPEWPFEFERERSALAAVLAPLTVRIEHIGSTSVPGMSAKPIIDIMLGVPKLEDIETRMHLVEQLGYVHLPEMLELMPDNRFFAKPATLPRRFHLHAVEYDGEFWRDHIVFRDALRADARLAGDYAALKTRLADEFSNQPKRYTDAKGPFINEAVAKQQRR
jgi:GrpB-like predicted nucleotidyltransferase (UPF0157 family)